mmetsp:Transcript_9761/g.28663  ORF Transcript_9761/g.28663 Transcript_9761/m.28663 type:complete len:281 (-) Transcript_9761:358-1200(-)
MHILVAAAAAVEESRRAEAGLINLAALDFGVHVLVGLRADGGDAYELFARPEHAGNENSKGDQCEGHRDLRVAKGCPHEEEPVVKAVAQDGDEQNLVEGPLVLGALDEAALGHGRAHEQACRRVREHGEEAAVPGNEPAGHEAVADVLYDAEGGASKGRVDNDGAGVRDVRAVRDSQDTQELDRLLKQARAQEGLHKERPHVAGRIPIALAILRQADGPVHEDDDDRERDGDEEGALNEDDVHGAARDVRLVPLVGEIGDYGCRDAHVDEHGHNPQSDEC